MYKRPCVAFLYFYVVDEENTPTSVCTILRNHQEIYVHKLK